MNTNLIGMQISLPLSIQLILKNLVELFVKNGKESSAHYSFLLLNEQRLGETKSI